MKKLIDVQTQCQIQKEKYNLMKESLNKTDPLNVNYLDKRTETIDEFRKYKNLYQEKIELEKNKDKNCNMLAYFLTTLAGFGLGAAISNGTATIFNLIFPDKSIIPIVITTIIITNIYITKTLNSYLTPILENLKKNKNELADIYLKLEIEELENILSYGFYKRQQFDNDNIIDVENKELQINNEFESVDLIFNLPKKNKVYTKKKY